MNNTKRLGLAVQVRDKLKLALAFAESAASPGYTANSSIDTTMVTKTKEANDAALAYAGFLEESRKLIPKNYG